MQWSLEQLRKFRRKDVFGLDIGPDAIKVVQLSKNGDGYTTTAAGITNIPSHNSNNATTITDAIQDCLNTSGIQTQLAVCSVSGQAVAARSFNFPSLPSDEIPGAVQFEAAQVCPFDVNNAAVDYQLIYDDAKNAQGVLVAATNPIIETKRQLVKAANLDCCLMDVDGLALLNCFSECEKPQTQEPVTILNIGASNTTLVIRGNNNLPFIRNIAFGGNDIIQLIANERNIAPEIITANLFDPEDSSRQNQDTTNYLESACQRLVVDIKESLRYYKTQEKSAPAEKMLTCGSFAMASGLIETLNSHLVADVVLWNPFEKIGCHQNSNCRDILKKNGPAMAVVAGLAMRSI